MRESAEYDVKDFEDVEGTKGVYAKFYKVAKEDEAASKREGRPIFVDKDYVEIIAAGNANNIVRRPVTDFDIRRFRKQYEQFKAGDTEQLSGTPLAEVAWITRSMVDELAYKRVRTLEHLAEMSDQVCTSMPGLYELKRKAITQLQRAAEQKPFAELEARMTAMAEKMAAQEAELLRTKAALESTQSEKVKRAPRQSSADAG